MRPLMGTFLRPAIVRARTGYFDEDRGITVRADGTPAVEAAATETFTKVRDEPIDDPPNLETFTEVRDERTDEEPEVVASNETLTRVRDEPVDDEAGQGFNTAVVLGDSVVGVVYF